MTKDTDTGETIVKNGKTAVGVMIRHVYVSESASLIGTARITLREETDA